MCHLTPTAKIQTQKLLPSSPASLRAAKTGDLLVKSPSRPHGFAFYFATDISVLYGLFCPLKIWGSVFIWTSFKYLHILYNFRYQLIQQQKNTPAST